MTTIRTFLFTLFALLLCAGSARASSATIEDRTDYITPADAVGIASDAASAPFDLHILVELAPSLDALEDDAHALVTGPRVMVLAIDSGRHRVVVRFGSATGVKPGDFESIARAGNAHFRAHEVREGVNAIVLRAEASARSTTAISASSEPVVLEHGMTSGTFFVILIFGASFIGLVVWLWARRRKDRAAFAAALEENRLETAELRSRNAEELAWSDSVAKAKGRPVVRNMRRPVAADTAGGYAAQAGDTHVHNTYVGAAGAGGGSNDLALGMMIGEEIEDRRNRATPAAPISTARRADPDTGGGSSSYDAGSSASDYTASPPDVDTGGSSSSFNTGGSADFSDSGGGSFDGGGGSADF